MVYTHRKATPSHAVTMARNQHTEFENRAGRPKRSNGPTTVLPGEEPPMNEESIVNRCIDGSLQDVGGR